jgi:hypothetical protein
MMPLRYFIALLSLVFATAALADSAQYPPQRPERKTPAAVEGSYTVRPGNERQIIRGIGFEIQSDSIASGNSGLPEAFTSVPHDLVPSERERFAKEMLKGFRYCRLAGGLYWRGTDPEGKFLQGRWPEQLPELRQMIDTAGIEGVSLEYWSPAPYWKANNVYVGKDPVTDRLRCFGPNFTNDAVYRGDTNRFCKDFSGAFVHDIQHLRDNGIRVVMWGLQNEPRAMMGRGDYSRCGYRKEEYVAAFRAVAPAIRACDPQIEIICDSWELKYAEPLMADPATRGFIDSLVLHHVGCDANEVFKAVKATRAKFGREKPVFQNEYEYLWGQTTPDRCLNTVLHIMNWFQIGEAPAWFWIHALKPVGNVEASGYSLGFWRPANDTNALDHPRFPGLKPGYWTWNKYNWHAVGSFVKHMPWDCRSVEIQEQVQDPDLRVLAFKKPDGKLTVVLANRSFREHTFHVDTGLANATLKGWRYTPDLAGADCRGVEIGTLTGGKISPKTPDLAWEFWEQQ